MADFLTFQTLISRHALLVFYYLGAVVMPVAAWLLAIYLMRRVEPIRAAYRSGRDLLTARVPLHWRLLGILLLLVMFFLMELMWRILFEYLIAFMQMRDAIVVGAALD